MSKIRYACESFNPVQENVIRQAAAFCAQYAADGYQLTLRQLYYRFIATDAFPDSRLQPIPGSGEMTKNHERNYKWLGDLVSRARVGGLIDWDHISDRGREHAGGDAGWPSPASAMRSITRAYGITHWDGQPEYVEVFVEKDALSQVIERVASRWNVTSFACKGSPSTSAVHEAALRLRREEDDGRKVTVIYLGDHDPTGIDISRDIQERLRLFRSDAFVDRIALNMDQITDDLPPSPAKATDSRTNGYIDRFGTDECWELDALEPRDLDAMIEAAILEHLEMGPYQARLDREEQERRELTAIQDNWARVQAFLASEGLLSEDEDDDDDGI